MFKYLMKNISLDLNLGAQAAGNAAAAVASGQPETAIEHTDYRNKLSEIRTIYHQEVLLEITSLSFYVLHDFIIFLRKILTLNFFLKILIYSLRSTNKRATSLQHT